MLSKDPNITNLVFRLLCTNWDDKLKLLKNSKNKKIVCHALCITPYTKICGNTLSIILNFYLFSFFFKRKIKANRVITFIVRFLN